MRPTGSWSSFSPDPLHPLRPAQPESRTDLMNAPRPPTQQTQRARRVVLTGNPNSGKTTLFNALTGLRAKVANYAGVTVERKEGRLLGCSSGAPVTLLDLPGTYSLSPQSLDERIARDVLLQRLPGEPPPDRVVVVVDAGNLERNLFYATQVIELGYPTAIALNMMDVARENGRQLDVSRLARELGAPVFPMVASTREGVPAFRDCLLAAPATGCPTRPASPLQLPAALAAEVQALARHFDKGREFPDGLVCAEALLALTDSTVADLVRNEPPSPVDHEVGAARARLEAAGVDWRSAAIEARYASISGIHDRVVTESSDGGTTLSDRLDAWVTHHVWGLVVFAGVMILMFQSIFALAQGPMTVLEHAVAWMGQALGTWVPPGPLRSLLVDGLVAGVGAVVVFLPQICLLFLFLGLLEDTGYMARAAFLMDRLMTKVGLHGKSFIPLLSSFACAIPGIMATRTLESPKDRLVTILVAPLMSCSARLPVYTLLIAACIPNQPVLGVLKLPGLVMLAMYVLGISLALAMAWVFKRTLLKGHTPMLIMELPPYRRPVLRVVLRHMWDRAQLFLTRAGTVILGINVLLWFLVSYPHDEARSRHYERQRLAAAHALEPGLFPESPALSTETRLKRLREWHARRPEAQPGSPRHPLSARLDILDREEAGESLRGSFAGTLGRWIEPLIRPLGFDWKIGIGIVASVAAREVFVSTMSVVYNVGSTGDPDEDLGSLAQTMRRQQRENGIPVYTPRTGITLMVFYVLALQCVSTVVIVRRETGSWRWPLFQWIYMSTLAWLLAYAANHTLRLLGLP